MEQDTNAPYTAEELMDLAAMEASRRRIPESLRDDAIQEFVIAAWEAGQRGGENPRGYQFIRGRGAMMKFWQREIIDEQAVPPECPEGAMRLSFDAPANGMDGESTTLAEVIADPNAAIPGEEPPQQADTAGIKAALAVLTKEEREAATRVLVEGQSQRDAAAEMGIGRKKIRLAVENARARIESRYPHAVSLVAK